MHETFTSEKIVKLAKQTNRSVVLCGLMLYFMLIPIVGIYLWRHGTENDPYSFTIWVLIMSAVLVLPQYFFIRMAMRDLAEEIMNFSSRIAKLESKEKLN